MVHPRADGSSDRSRVDGRSRDYSSCAVRTVCGVILDRYQTKRILIIADLVRAAAFFALAIGAEGDASTWMVFATAFVVGTMSTFFDSGLQALLPSVVGDDLLVAVNAKLSLARTLAWPVGVGVAGILVAQPGGFSIVFAANSYSFILSALFLWRVKPIRERPKQARLGKRSGVWAGVRFLRNNPTLKWATIGAAVTNLVFAPLEILLLKFVDEKLLATASLPGFLETMFQGPARVGFFVALQAAIGSIGILVAPRVAGRLKLGRMYVIGMLALGLGFAVVSAMSNFWAVLPAGFALAGVGWVNVAFFTLRQRLTPEEMLGRVIAASRTVSWILIPVGAALGGWLADRIGLVPVYLFGSLAVVGVATVMLATPLYAADGSPSPTRWDRAIMHGSSTRGRE